jgi:excisionase family DNA binding protein
MPDRFPTLGLVREGEPGPALPTVEAVAQLEAEALPGFVGQLAALLAAASARMRTSTRPAAVPAMAKPATEQEPFTQEEAAERYRIPLRTLRRLTRARILPSTQVGRNRMIRPADLDAYLARCRDQGRPVGVRLDAYRRSD